MAFQRLIQSNIDRAYRAVGDLAESIIIAPQSSGTYNFASGQRENAVTGTPVTVSALVQVVTRDADGRSISPTVVMTIPSHRVTVSLNEYTRITRPDGNIYDVIDWEDDGFTTTVRMRRETR